MFGNYDCSGVVNGCDGLVVLRTVDTESWGISFYFRYYTPELIFHRRYNILESNHILLNSPQIPPQN